MSMRLERAIDEVNRIERRIQMYQNQKREAMARLKLVENEEIIRSVRAMNLNRNDLVNLLKGLQEGKVTFSDIPEPEEVLERRDEAGQDGKETVSDDSKNI